MATSTTSHPSTVQSKRRLIQNYILIWVDSNIDEKSTDCQNTLEKLHNVVADVTIFKQPEQCIQFLNTMDDEKAFVISSGALGENLVPRIHRLPKVDVIYIFCGNKARNEVWASNWPKIKGVFTLIDPICESLRKVARQCDQDNIAMSVIPKQSLVSTASDPKEKNRLPPSYMYTLLFKRIIMDIKYDNDNKSVNELIAYCRGRAHDVPESQLNNFKVNYYTRTALFFIVKKNQNNW